jgi:hypothetical protein
MKVTLEIRKPSGNTGLRKCSCCGERRSGKYLQVIESDGKVRRDENYCIDCTSLIHTNNPDVSKKLVRELRNQILEA